MQLNKPVSNPMLVGSMELLRAENTPEHRKMFEEEVFKAVFLAPVIVEPVPEPDEKGMINLKPGSQVKFPMLASPDGKHFYMAFTDWTELRKWKDTDGQQTFAMSFDDYMGMLFKKDPQGNTSPAAGFVINPFGANIVITRELAEAFMKDRMASYRNNNNSQQK
jgi:hypothetical protein